MADVVVTHIEKTQDAASGVALKSLGNPNTPQGGWRWTAAQVIASIEAGSNTFFVRDLPSGRRYDIGILHSETGAPKLTTLDDGRPTEHLMNLTQFS